MFPYIIVRYLCNNCSNFMFSDRPKRMIKNVDGAMHFIYSHKHDSNSAKDSSDMN